MFFVTPVLLFKYIAEESGLAGSQGDGVPAPAQVRRRSGTWADPKDAPGCKVTPAEPRLRGLLCCSWRRC